MINLPCTEEELKILEGYDKGNLTVQPLKIALRAILRRLKGQVSNVININLQEEEEQCYRKHGRKWMKWSRYGEYKICNFRVKNGRICGIRIFPKEESA